jgi:hypothetical protein
MEATGQIEINAEVWKASFLAVLKLELAIAL